MQVRTDETGVEWMKVVHPDTGGESEVTKAAFEEVWQEKGWIAKPDVQSATADQVPFDAAQPNNPPT